LASRINVSHRRQPVFLGENGNTGAKYHRNTRSTEPAPHTKRELWVFLAEV